MFRGNRSSQIWMAAVLSFITLGDSTQAQQEIRSTNVADNPPAYAITDTGADFRLWQQTVPAFTNGQGQVVYRTNSYTEMATGMNVLSNGRWIAANENIQITPGGAAATGGRHQVLFDADINTSNAVQITTPDGLSLKSHVGGNPDVFQAIGDPFVIK